LGVKSHRYSLRESRTILRVLPKLAFPGPSDEMVTETYYSPHVERALKRLKAYLCIEVTNQSSTTQTILEVGIVDQSGNRVPWRQPDWMEPSETFPLTLRPDQCGAAYVRIMPEECTELNSVVYAKTDRGEYFMGDSPIITDFIARLEKMHF